MQVKVSRGPERAPGVAGGPGAGLPRQAQPGASSQLLLRAAKATEITTTTSNFLQEPHTGGEKISQAFPMKSFPQALPTPRASWLGAGPSSLHPTPGCAGRGSSRVCVCATD